jgi:hypothetical protein
VEETKMENAAQDPLRPLMNSCREKSHGGKVKGRRRRGRSKINAKKKIALDIM